MRKISKFAAVLLVPTFLMASSCTPTQVSAANTVLNGVSVAVPFAKSLIQVAESQYSGNAKVVAALAATRAALTTLEGAVAAVGAGIEKDWNKLAAAVSDLFLKALNLKTAIEQAIAANKSVVK
jgi:hypothetical protein